MMPCASLSVRRHHRDTSRERGKHHGTQSQLQRTGKPQRAVTFENPPPTVQRPVARARHLADVTASVEFRKRAWSEQDDLAATHWLQTVERITVTPAVTAQAVELVARDSAYHPVRSYLRSCAWDGQERLATLLTTYFGAEPSTYTEAIGRMMMISAVARIFDPGCQVDTMLILEGEQGLMKSTAAKTLFSPWFTDDIEQLGTKDASMQVAGASGASKLASSTP